MVINQFIGEKMWKNVTRKISFTVLKDIKSYTSEELEIITNLSVFVVFKQGFLYISFFINWRLQKPVLSCIFFHAAKLCSLYRPGSEDWQRARSGLCVDQSGEEVGGACWICHESEQRGILVPGAPTGTLRRSVSCKCLLIEMIWFILVLVRI